MTDISDFVNQVSEKNKTKRKRKRKKKKKIIENVHDIDDNNENEESFIVPNRNSNGAKTSKMVNLKRGQRKNKFKQSSENNMKTQHDEESANTKNAPIQGFTRKKVEKLRYRCESCNQEHSIFPSQLIESIGAEPYYLCSQCLKGNR